MQHHRTARYCVALALVAAVALALGAPVGRLLPLALALACPLMMVLMMKGMHGAHRASNEEPHAHSGQDGDTR